MSQESSLRYSGIMSMEHDNNGSHSFTWYPHVYQQTEWTSLALTSQPHTWLALISRLTEGMRMRRPEWLVAGKLMQFSSISMFPWPFADFSQIFHQFPTFCDTSLLWLFQLFQAYETSGHR